jgi:hypothetical protein
MFFLSLWCCDEWDASTRGRGLESTTESRHFITYLVRLRFYSHTILRIVFFSLVFSYSLCGGDISWGDNTFRKRRTYQSFIVFMEETTNATVMTTGEALINAGFRKRYFVLLYQSISRLPNG